MHRPNKPRKSRIVRSLKVSIFSKVRVTNILLFQDDERSAVLYLYSRVSHKGAVLYGIRGGPVPKDSFSGFSSHRKWQPLGYVSQWGGMEIGSEMLYPVSVVDGMVHQLGGWPLRFEIQQLQVHGLEKGIKCPIGEAVVTSSCNRFLKRSSKLYKEYSYIVHTSPPFYNHSSTGDPFKLLRLCYRNSLSAAFDLTDSISTTGRVAIAVPLLGAGARGFPLETALEIAASETLSWCRENSEQSVKHTQLCIAFGIPDKDTAELLSSKLKLKMFEKL